MKKAKNILPILEWLPNYNKTYLSSDVISGITVAFMIIPQGMAYALIAGLPPVYGLYAGLVPLLIYAILGSTKQVAVGPVALDSMIVAAGLGMMSISGVENYIAMAILMTLMIGCIQLLLGTFKLGFLANYLSRPVIGGFTSAAAIIIGLSQMKHILGISTVQSNQFHVLLFDILKQLGNTHYLTLALGVGTIIILLGLKRLPRKVPSAIIVVILGILIGKFFLLEEKGVNTVGVIPEGLPSFSVPSIDMSNLYNLFPVAFTIAFMAFIEVISIGKAIDEKNNQDILKPNQELVALGFANIIGSFFQSYSVSASFSRSAVSHDSGAKSTISMIVTAIIVGSTLMFLTGLFHYLPLAVLAGIIMTAVFSLIDIDMAKNLFDDQKDEFLLWTVTFLVTLFIGIKEGIIVGVLLSLVVTIYKLSHPHVAVLGQIKGTDYFKNINRFSDDVVEIQDTIIMRFDSPLFYGNQDFFKTTINDEIHKANRPIKQLVLVAEAMNYIDSTGLATLKRIKQDLNNRDIALYLTNANGPVRDVLFKGDIIDEHMGNRMFVDVEDAIEFIQGEHDMTHFRKDIARQSMYGKKS